MRCQEIKSWTFRGLVAAFVDLSIAFSLLSASVIVYLTSKFLGLFGLNLPCPCDGLFSENKCFQETLRNLPVKNITSVQKSVKNKTPFDSALCKEANGDCIGKKRKECFSSPFVEEVDSWVEKNASGFDLLTSQSRKKGSFKIKSKRLSFYKSPYGLKNHFQGSLGHKNLQQSPSENDPLLVNSKELGKALEDVSLRKSVSLSSVGSEAGGQNKQPERTFSWAGEGTCSSPVDLTYSGMTQKTIEILEQVLAEERAARAALALELEKERNAAASAADEALSMILRLQEEKASIEMEATQYQRIIEEKSAFDAEEMSILKEILLRREKEKHYLEKEVDSYRQMFLETEQPLLNTPDSKPAQVERSETPQQMTEPLDYDNAYSTKAEEIDNDQSRSEGLKEREEHRSSNISDSKKLSEDSHNIDSPVHDIHVVANEDNKIQLHVVSDHGTRDLKLDRSQSVSDTSYGLPPACSQGQRNMSPTMRRNSMSAVDYERLKIESEVGLLRGRLRAVQKGRAKISFSSNEQSKTSRFKEARRSGPLDSSTPSSTMVKTMSMSLDLHSA